MPVSCYLTLCGDIYAIPVRVDNRIIVSVDNSNVSMPLPVSCYLTLCDDIDQIPVRV